LKPSAYLFEKARGFIPYSFQKDSGVSNMETSHDDLRRHVLAAH
jgi:hypothetical protein